MTLTQSKAMPSIQQVLPTFQELLPIRGVRDLMEASGGRFYERLFTPLIVVWCFIFQRLNADHSLDAVVSHVSSGAVDPLDERDRSPVSERIRSESTAAYSKARKRIPLAVLKGVTQHFAQAAEQHLDGGALWRGHPVVLLDGTTLLLRPEAELVKHYGQACNQHGIAYWVLMRVVAAFSLQTAVLLGVAEGPRLESEQSLAKTVLSQLAPQSVCVGDSNFGVFSVAQAARHYDLCTLLRLTACRAKALAKRTLHPDDDLPIRWAPSSDDRCDPQMSEEPIAGRLLYVRLERDGFRPIALYFFTTLLDASSYPLAELVMLYGRRWHAELDLRYVKSTLDMELLTAKSVEMARKELWASLASYNLVRVCMAMAAREAGLTPLDLSFTKCWRRVRQISCSLPPTDTPDALATLLRRLLARLAKCRLQSRVPFRVEPRAVRRRSIQYPPLKGPRDKARQLALQKLLAEPTKC